MGQFKGFQRSLAAWIYERQRPGSRGLVIWKNLKELEQLLSEPKRKKKEHPAAKCISSIFIHFAASFFSLKSLEIRPFFAFGKIPGKFLKIFRKNACFLPGLRV